MSIPNDLTSGVSNDDYYADDVQAEALADNKLDPDSLVVNDDLPVTSGDMEIGDLDDDAELGQGGETSYDEEAVPAGDNVVDDDLTDTDVVSE